METVVGVGVLGLRLESVRGAVRCRVLGSVILSVLHSVPSRRTTRTALTLVLRRRSCDRVGDPPRPRTSLAHVAVVAPAKGRNSPSRLINYLSGSALAAPSVADGPLIRRLINDPGSALRRILRPRWGRLRVRRLRSLPLVGRYGRRETASCRFTPTGIGTRKLVPSMPPAGDIRRRP